MSNISSTGHMTQLSLVNVCLFVCLFAFSLEFLKQNMRVYGFHILREILVYVMF